MEVEERQLVKLSITEVGSGRALIRGLVGC